jgi:hypothetical protein
MSRPRKSRAAKTVVPTKETLADKYMKYFVPPAPGFAVKNDDYFKDRETSWKDFQITTTYGIDLSGTLAGNVKLD